MRRFRSYLAITLSLLLVLTSGAMAAARGHARSVDGQVILCTGQGAMLVAVDAQGKPVGPVHICPDCALSVFDSAHSATALPTPATGRVTRVALPPVKVSTASRAHTRRARAPPV